MYLRFVRYEALHYGIHRENTTAQQVKVSVDADGNLCHYPCRHEVRDSHGSTPTAPPPPPILTQTDTSHRHLDWPPTKSPSCPPAARAGLMCWACSPAASGATSLSNQDSNDSTNVMAAALVYARTGEGGISPRRRKQSPTFARRTSNQVRRALAFRGGNLSAMSLRLTLCRLSKVDADLDAKWRTKLAYLLTCTRPAKRELD